MTSDGVAKKIIANHLQNDCNGRPKQIATTYLERELKRRKQDDSTPDSQALEVAGDTSKKPPNPRS